MRQPYPNELMHYGVMGMKWGVRRYQNPDGTLTDAGRKRYGKYDKYSEKYDNAARKNLEVRAKVRSNIESRYDKKIARATYDRDSFNPIREGTTDKKGRVILTKDDVTSMVKTYQDKIDKLEEKKKARLLDYDEGTKLIQKGYKHGSDIVKAYKNVKIKALDDKEFKKSKEYKDAVNKYVNQAWLASQSWNSMDYVALTYAGNEARSGDQDNYKMKKS